MILLGSQLLFASTTPSLPIPPQMSFVLLLIPLASTLHLERLGQQRLRFCYASSKNQIAFLIVLLRRGTGSNRSDVTLDIAEVGHDLGNPHCSSLIDCCRASRSASVLPL